MCIAVHHFVSDLTETMQISSRKNEFDEIGEKSLTNFIAHHNVRKFGNNNRINTSYIFTDSHWIAILPFSVQNPIVPERDINESIDYVIIPNSSSSSFYVHQKPLLLSHLGVALLIHISLVWHVVTWDFQHWLCHSRSTLEIDDKSNIQAKIQLTTPDSETNYHVNSIWKCWELLVETSNYNDLKNIQAWDKMETH